MIMQNQVELSSVFQEHDIEQWTEQQTENSGLWTMEVESMTVNSGQWKYTVDSGQRKADSGHEVNFGKYVKFG